MYYYLRGSLFPYTFTDLIFFHRETTKIMTSQSVPVFINVTKRKDFGQSAL